MNFYYKYLYTMSGFDNNNVNLYSPDSIMSGDSLEQQRNNLPLSTFTGFIEDSLERAINKVEKGLEHGTECENQGEHDPVEFLDREVFPVLLPCLEQMLFAAKENNVLKVEKCRFSGVDHLAELLWNHNHLHPERQTGHYVSLFDIPFVKTHLENKPRPVYPKSWLWSAEEAAVVIQAAVRGHLVRRTPEVQEMRQFWRTLAGEHSSEING